MEDMLYGIKPQYSNRKKKLKLTQEQLAEKCSVSRQAVTKWESGESEPSIAKLKLLSKVFDISIDELITRRKHKCVVNGDYENKITYNDGT